MVVTITVDYFNVNDYHIENNLNMDLFYTRDVHHNFEEQKYFVFITYLLTIIWANVTNFIRIKYGFLIDLKLLSVLELL